MSQSIQSLFNATPILVDASGKGYSATKESVDAASIVTMNLTQNGEADFTLDFPVGADFAATTVILNNGVDSPISPTLRAKVKVQP